MVPVILHIMLNFNTNTIAHILHWPSPILLILTHYCLYAKMMYIYVYNRELYDEIGKTGYTGLNQKTSIAVPYE